MEQNLSCPICQEVYKEPVLLSCSHSFCGVCLRSWWREKPTQECPVCKRRSSRSDPPSNLVLRNLCEEYLQQKEQKVPQEHVCPLHSETFKVFCLSDQQPVCVVCRHSKAHKDHIVQPIEEEATFLRKELRKDLQRLTDKVQEAEEGKEELEFVMEHIKKQFNQTEKQICDEFEKLHLFLEKEEDARLKALKEEEKQKTQRMKDKMAAVSREIEVLSKTIRDTEEQLRAADVSFLLNYKATVERVQHCPLLEEPQLGPGALIDQAKHLGNLIFNIWSKMKSLVHYSPVILDPNTADSCFVLSDSLTSFKSGPKLRLPKNPERFNISGPVVRGSEGFHSGSHSWDVQVRESHHWILGVMSESASENLEWAIVFSNGQYNVSVQKKETALKLKYCLSRVRLVLDCSNRRLTLHNVDTDTRIHRFSQVSSKKLIPFFANHSKEPMTVLEEQI